MKTDFIRPHPEAAQRIGTEGVVERDIGGVTASGNQDPAYARRIVAGIEGVPAAVEKHLEPGGEIHRAVRRRRADVAQVAGAITGRDIHAAAKGHRQMGIVTADADSFVECFQRGARHARVFIAEHDVVMDVVADRLHAAPARRGMLKQLPRNGRQAIRLTVAAAEQKQQRLFRQVLYRQLSRLRGEHVRRAGVVDDGIGRNADTALRRDDARTPVAETVAVSRARDRRIEHQVVAADQIGHPREVDIQVENHGRRLRAIVDHFKTDMDFHDRFRFSAASCETQGAGKTNGRG